MRVAHQALYKLKSMLLPGARILDIGSGKGEHAQWFKEKGFQVTTTDILESDYPGDFNKIWDRIRKEEGEFDAVWCSHCLEHQRDPGLFLDKVFALAKPQVGIVAITVPPLKEALVGGHLLLYTTLSLVYNVVVSGIDCKKASIKKYDYNISLITRRVEFELPQLNFDYGDIEKLKDYFPVEVYQNVPGFEYNEVNW